jgi:hypothetical protein
MSELLWNVIGVTIIGGMILLVRRTSGGQIHPRILTAYWIVFFVVSLMPLYL